MAGHGRHGGPRVEVLFRLPEEDDGWPPADVESVWAEKLRDGVYRVDSIPFFIRGISLNDDIRVCSREGELWFAGLVGSNGHRTVRVVTTDPAPVDSVREELRAIGCRSELSHLPSLISVDVPPGVDAGPLRRWLEARFEVGDIDYEEGNVDW